MVETSRKQIYAQAVLSGFMTKSGAYLTFINAECAHPSQAAYKLEQTKQMKRIMQAEAETRALRTNLVIVTDKTATLLQELINQQDDLPVSQQLAVIRAANNLSGKAKNVLSESQIPRIPHTEDATLPVLDKASVII